jgi:hypothetical protein
MQTETRELTGGLFVNVKNAAIKMQDFNKVVDAIQNEPLKSILTNYKSSLNRVNKLLLYPYFLCFFGQMEVTHVYDDLLNDLTKLQNGSTVDQPTADHKEPADYEDEVKKPEIIKAHKTKADIMLTSLVNACKPLNEAHFEALLPSALILLWSGIEILAKDVWEFTVNTNQIIANSLIDSIRKHAKDNDDSAQRYTLNLDDLIKYNFNLKDKIGTILVDKYDFSSLEGIKRAYQLLVKDESNIFLRDQIKRLVAMRNIIVHNNSKVDTLYCRMLNLDTAAVGKNLNLKHEDVVGFGEECIKLAVDLSNIGATHKTP